MESKTRRHQHKAIAASGGVELSLATFNEGACYFVDGERAVVLRVGHCRLQHGEHLGEADAFAWAITAHRGDTAFFEHFGLGNAVHLGHICNAANQEAVPAAIGIRQVHLQFNIHAEVLKGHVRWHHHFCHVAVCLVFEQ